MKIRGLRIELGEIEVVMSQVESVREAVAVALPTPGAAGGTQLVAYVAPSSADRDAVVAHCTQTLPQYMVPSTIVCVAEWPRTSSGKIDRKALPAPQRDDWIMSSTEQVAPRTKTEVAIADVWKELLGITEVFVHDNFFELGGNSLRAMQMLPRLRNALDVGESLSVADVFSSPTVRSLCTLVESRPGSADSAADHGVALIAYPRSEGERTFPVSFAQEQMLVLHSMDPSSSQYNVPWCVRLDGNLDVDVLRRSFDWVVGRHEVLRTVFKASDNDGTYVQSVVPVEDYELSFRVEDTGGCGVSDGGDASLAVAMRLVDEEANAAFDLERGPVIRVLVVRVRVSGSCHTVGRIRCSSDARR